MKKKRERGEVNKSAWEREAVTSNIYPMQL